MAFLQQGWGYDLNRHQISLVNNTIYKLCSFYICRLDKSKGLDLGDTYCNEKGGKNFIKAIAATVKKDIHEQLDKASFITILSDGAMDVSSKEQEIVYCRYVLKLVSYLIKDLDRT